MMNNEMHWSEGNHKLHGLYIRVHVEESKHGNQWHPACVWFHDGSKSAEYIEKKKVSMGEEFERYLEERVTASSPAAKAHRFGE